MLPAAKRLDLGVMEVAKRTLILRIAFVVGIDRNGGVFDNAASQQETTVELQARSRGYMPDSHNAASSSEYMVFENTKYLATSISKGRGVGRPRGVMYFTQCTTTYTLLLRGTRRELTLTLSGARRCMIRYGLK